MELSTEVKKSAFRVGYRLGIGVGTFYDWVKARDMARPEAIRPGAWVQAFDKIAEAARRYGESRLNYCKTKLDQLTDIEVDSFFEQYPNSGATFTEYPREHYDTSKYDVLAAIDAGVEELV